MKKDLQIENGQFTRIANKILDALVSACLGGSELSICLFVIRKTYGFNKTSDNISLTQFQKGTKLSRPTIIKALKNLQLVNTLLLVKKGSSKNVASAWQFNKYVDSWRPLVKTPLLVKNQKKPGKDLVKNLVNTGLHTKDNTKDKQKTVLITRFQKPSYDQLNTYVKDENLSVNPNAFLDYYESKGWKVGKAPMKDWKSAARNWHRRSQGGLNSASGSSSLNQPAPTVPEPAPYKEPSAKEKADLRGMMADTVKSLNARENNGP